VPIIIIPPAVGSPVTEATPIVVTAAFIPADKVVLTPLEVPSAGDLKKVYTACPSTNVTFWFFTSQK